MLFNNMIYSVIFHLKRELYEATQYSVSHHALKESEIKCFTEKDMAAAEWKEEKEFTLNGYSYDVIKVSIVNGEKYFVCYMDKKDIIINSILDFSKKLSIKKTYVWRQINLPVHEKNVLKTSGLFTVFDRKEFHFFLTQYLNILPHHYNPINKTHYLSIIIPPPETGFVL